MVTTIRASVLLVGALAALTAGRVPDWQNDVTLWRATTQTAPTRPRAWVNLGAALIREGDYPGGLAAIRTGETFSADSRRGWFEREWVWASGETNLGIAAWMTGHDAAAWDRFQAVLQVYPHFQYALAYRAMVKAQRGDCAGAKADLAQTVTLHLVTPCD